MDTRARYDTLAGRIDALLPQTQCRKCGYPGCRPYAQAIAEGEADINRCPPGGAAGIRRLAALLGREFKPLSPEHGVEKPRELAVIDEQQCIGCTLCIQVCPVDAIVGAAKLMHTVLAELCTGCELCLAPCPVDCIRMQAVPAPEGGCPAQAVDATLADAARERFEFRNFRLERDAQEKQQRLSAAIAGAREPIGSAKAPALEPRAEEPSAAGSIDAAGKKELIAAAMERVRARKDEPEIRG